MKRLALALLLTAALTGCAAFDVDDPMEREVAALRSPEMDAAIHAARPGVPRVESPAH